MPADREAAEVRHTLAVLQRGARFPLVFGGVVARERELRVSTLLGNAGESLRGLLVPGGRGVGGRALATRRPVAVGDYYTSDAISHDFDEVARAESIRSLVAVPVIVRRVVRAVLYGAVREMGLLADVSIGAAVNAARDLEQELAIRDEVERRMAELHAHTASALSSASSAEREALRRGHAELRAIGSTLTDPELRTRIDAVCATLTLTAAPSDRHTPRLSQREVDVLACVAMGCTNVETARTLAIGPETVKSYLRSAMSKLDAHSRVQAVNAARMIGQLP
ncbi:helix-turn-helix transcriptional regulator [Streptosporangium sp. NPDC002607]